MVTGYKLLYFNTQNLFNMNFFMPINKNNRCQRFTLIKTFYLSLVIYLLLPILIQNSLIASINNQTDFSFQRLSIEKGLSQITVHSIIQDSKGFLWIGTEDGLNRYDGYKFVTYRNDKNDSTTISDNFIWSIVEDSKGNIWIGTNSGGLNKFDYNKNSFTRYNYDRNLDNNISENNIRALHIDNDDNLWIGTQSSGLYYFDTNTNDIKKINIHNESKMNFFHSILDIEEDDKFIWFATNGGGIIKYDKSADSFQTITTFIKLNGDRIDVRFVWSVLSDENILWFGTYGQGLLKYDINTGHALVYSENSKNIIANNNVTDLAVMNNLVWICTEDGLSILNKNTNQIRTYHHNPADIESISNNILRCIYIDRLDIVWIGTFGGGVNKVNSQKRFTVFKHNPTDANTISHNMIRSLHEDRKGNIWVGTLGKGLNKIHPNRKRIENFVRSDSPNSISDNIITSIIDDKYGNLWVGTWGGGLNKLRFNTKNKSNTIINSNLVINTSSTKPFRISSNIVQSLFIDSSENLWIGTEDGLNIYNLKSSQFLVMYNDPNNFNSLSDNRIQSNSILEDQFGNIWIGTWKGLNRISFPNGKSELENYRVLRFLNDPRNPSTLSDNRVISLYEQEVKSSDSSSILWIGTIGGGLNKLEILPDDIEINFERYTEEDGLPNNVIYGILGDDNGNIWLSTNNGLSKFNPETLEFRNYSITDGLQSNQFSWGAFSKTRNGELFFGGINGLNSFFPENIEDNKNIPPVYITSFSVSSLSGNEDFNKLSLNPFNKINSSLFPYDNYSVSIEFAALDFTTPESNQYEYMLEGYDKDWIKTNIPRVNYASISDGDYVFKVRGSNNDQIWNNEGSTFAFSVSTPFWKTIWFTALIIILIIGVVFYLLATQIKNMLAVERLRTKLAADLHDNIGSSLTEISILSEVIGTRLQEKDEDIKRNLNKISEKSRGLIDKMSDIVWLVNPKRDSLYDLILRLQDTYSELLADTNISLRSENLKSLASISLKMEDRQHLFLIFKEAINNSITHGDCTDIFLNAKVSGRKIEMTLVDNGTGFSGNTRYFGNGLSNMQDRAKLIGGKLFIDSEVDKGTTVRYIGNIN
jgi:ligand-binding sensor domain-containing protein/two-component sensor histidine kinase